MGFSIVTSGIFVALLAVVIVVGRVLWPKEWFQQRRDEWLFERSVREMRQGLEELEHERYDVALQLFKEAAAKTPRKPAPVLLRIYALGLQGRRREAAAELQQARQRWAATTFPRRLLALAQIGAGEYDRSYQCAQEAANEQPVVFPAFRTLGDICRLLERYPEAERAYLRAITMGAKRPFAGLAWVLAGQGKIDEAEQELADAPPDVLELFESRLTLAQIHYRARRLEDALAVYRVLRHEHGNVPRVLVPYGMTLLEADRFDEAFSILEHVVAVSPEDPFAHAALARCYLDMDDLAHATVHVREALRLWPGFGEARSIFGDIRKRTSRYKDALDQYREALRLNPFLAETHLRLASLLNILGGPRLEAQEHEREAERLRPPAPQPISRDVLSRTTSELAAIKLPPPDPSPTLLRLPRMKPSSLPPDPPTGAPRGLPNTISDIVVFPGATLLSDEADEAFLQQMLQTDREANEVLDFYRQRMLADGWHLVREAPSALTQIEGVALYFIRADQDGRVTIGRRRTTNSQLLAPGMTLIVTQITHPRANGAA